jgi:hypothetical protein
MATPPQEKSETFVKRNADRGDHCFCSLDMQVQQVNWPTPREAASRDANHDRGKCNLGEVVHGLHAPDSPSTSGKSQGLWYSPDISDRRSVKSNQQGISNQVRGKLNPDWVEQLMGLKVGWTAFDYSETALSHSRQKRHLDT